MLKICYMSLLWSTWPGDRIFGLLAGGGYAQQVVTHKCMVMPIPAALSFEPAAAIPEGFLTAYDALLDKANLQAGDRVLIHAGGSGVGTAAIQLAKAMGASRIFNTSRTDWKLKKCLEMGADVAFICRWQTNPRLRSQLSLSSGCPSASVNGSQ